MSRCWAVLGSKWLVQVAVICATALMFFCTVGNSIHRQVKHGESGSSVHPFKVGWQPQSNSEYVIRGESNNIEVFWINLKKDMHRRNYMEQMLAKMPNIVSKRVEAVSPSSEEFKVIMLEKPCKRNTPHDLSVIISHLKAIYAAVESKTATSNYALILEDDVRLLYDIDIDIIVSTAPRPFGILQLVTSNVEAIESLWNKFLRADNISASDSLWTENKWNDMTKDKKTTLYWSAQAYLVNITHLKSFVDDVVEVGFDGHLGYKLVNSFFPQHCTRTKARPCVLANCLFSDSYIYAGGGPTYVSHIPFFNGANISLVSTLHQDHVSKHQQAFTKIDEIAAEIRRKFADGGVSGQKLLSVQI
jgi:GR25 family glycosyltransferase involved in LPS biosynthesis